MKNIDDFCDRKGVSHNMKEAFQAYLRSSYARKFFLNNGETVKLTVSKMNEKELEDAWKEFTDDFKKFLLTQS